MYARNYSENEKLQSFRRGEYNIPANYHGNAFIADEVPKIDKTDKIECNDEKVAKEAEVCESEGCAGEKGGISCPLAKSECTSGEGDRRKGLFGGILSRFDRGFELDDLLIIGLILILLNGEKAKCPENRDEIVILLALLLLGG